MNIKKVLIIIVLGIIILLVARNAIVIQRWAGDFFKFHRVVQNKTILEQIREDVLTPPPLRSNSGTLSGSLTSYGVIEQTNLQRKENGNLVLLSENTKLNLSAQTKLKDMFAKQYFEHESPTGKGPADLARAVEYEYVTIGENLALGNFKDNADLLNAWMNSPGHRANILNSKYTEMGAAVGEGMFEGRQVWLAVQEFGRPVSACPIVDKNFKIQIQSLQTDAGVILAQIDTLKNSLQQQDPKNREDFNAYNIQVGEYNNLVKIYNNKIDLLKQITEQYNSQVKLYNACVGS